MILSKFIPTFWSYMARKQSRRRQARTADELRVELVPVSDSSGRTSERSREIQFLVMKLVLLGNRRGRPPKQEEEILNAA